jgi:hypothetical protein
LSREAVYSTVLEESIDIDDFDAKPFAHCFKAQGLTDKDLRAAIATGEPVDRMEKCYVKLIGPRDLVGQ